MTATVTAASAAPIVDPRRRTESDPDYQRLQAQTEKRIHAAIARLCEDLRTGRTQPTTAQSVFIHTATSILEAAYTEAHAEGQRDYWQRVSAAPDTQSISAPDEVKLRHRLGFYAPSIAKMAHEALLAHQATVAGRTLAEVLPERVAQTIQLGLPGGGQPQGYDQPRGAGGKFTYGTGRAEGDGGGGGENAAGESRGTRGARGAGAGGKDQAKTPVLTKKVRVPKGTQTRNREQQERHARWDQQRQQAQQRQAAADAAQRAKEAAAKAKLDAMHQAALQKRGVDIGRKVARAEKAAQKAGRDKLSPEEARSIRIKHDQELRQKAQRDYIHKDEELGMKLLRAKDAHDAASSQHLEAARAAQEARNRIIGKAQLEGKSWHDAYEIAKADEEVRRLEKANRDAYLKSGKAWITYNQAQDAVAEHARAGIDPYLAKYGVGKVPATARGAGRTGTTDMSDYLRDLAAREAAGKAPQDVKLEGDGQSKTDEYGVAMPFSRDQFAAEFMATGLGLGAMGEQRGISPSYRATIGGRQYIVKTGEGVENVFGGYDQEIQARNEAATVGMLKALGHGDLAASECYVLREDSGRVWSVQSMEKGSGENFGKNTVDLARAIPEHTIQRAVMDEYLLGMQDRHSGNILIDAQSGRVVEIDHGFGLKTHTKMERSDFARDIWEVGARNGVYTTVQGTGAQTQVAFPKAMVGEALAKEGDVMKVAGDYHLNQYETKALKDRFVALKKAYYEGQPASGRRRVGHDVTLDALEKAAGGRGSKTQARKTDSDSSGGGGGGGLKSGTLMGRRIDHYGRWVRTGFTPPGWPHGGGNSSS